MVVVNYLTKEDLLKIHDIIQEKYKLDPGIVSEGLLETIVDIPSQTFYGQESYSTIREKAAAMLVNIVKLHAFIEGNKRTAILAVENFLQSNGVDIIIPPKTTRLSVVIAKTENEKLDMLIKRSTAFMRNYSLSNNDVKQSIRNISWMTSEIDEFIQMPEELQQYLLKYWLVYDMYPESEEKSEEIIGNYILKLSTAATVFMNTVVENQTN